MNTDLNTVLSQKRELDGYADSLRDARNNLIRHKASLDSAWQAFEISTIDDAIDRINIALYALAEDLNDIGTDMVKAFNDIEEEERIERERREAEERARQEAARREAERQEAERQAQAQAQAAQAQAAAAAAQAAKASTSKSSSSKSSASTSISSLLASAVSVVNKATSSTSKTTNKKK